MRRQILSRLVLVLTAGAAVMLWLLHGTQQTQLRPPAEPPLSPTLVRAEPEEAPLQQARELEKKARDLDQSIWAKEVLAIQHEAVFAKLWDDLRTNTNHLEVLSQFSFGELVLTDGWEPTLTEPFFAVAQAVGAPRRFTAQEWRMWIKNWLDEGFRLDQFEIRHVAFDANVDGTVRSKFTMRADVVHVQNPERYVFRGELTVDWKESATPTIPPLPELIRFTRLERMTTQKAPTFEPSFTYEIPSLSSATLLGPLIVYDLNGDGLSDIVLVDQNLALRNQGNGDFQPTPLCTEPSPALKTGVLADFTGDGAVDLLGADVDGLLLWTGDSAGRFTTPSQRIHFTVAGVANPSVLTVGDVDGDGDLDVWLGQDKPPYQSGQMPTPYYDANDGFPSFLLLNDGHGDFTDGTAEANLAAKRFRRAHSGSLVDVDNDGDLDLLVVSDFAGVDLYYNDGRGHFADGARTLGETHLFGMSHTFGDYDGDGTLDFLVLGKHFYAAERLDRLGLGREEFSEHQAMRSRMGAGNRLYGKLDENWQSLRLGETIVNSGWSWGATSFDFDNDGDLDVYVANGNQSRALSLDYESQFWRHDIYLGTSSPNRGLDEYFRTSLSQVEREGLSFGGYQKNCLFLNLGWQSFREIGFLAGVALERDCRNVVSEDVDHDGRMDLIVIDTVLGPQNRQTLHVLLNRWPSSNRWIGFNFRETRPGYAPVGTRVTLQTVSGRQIRHIVTGDSYRSQHANTAHFGLGDAEKILNVQIRWPNGQVEELSHPGLNRYLTVLPSTPTAPPNP